MTVSQTSSLASDVDDDGDDGGGACRSAWAAIVRAGLSLPAMCGRIPRPPCAAIVLAGDGRLLRRPTAVQQASKRESQQRKRKKKTFLCLSRERHVFAQQRRWFGLQCNRCRLALRRQLYVIRVVRKRFALERARERKDEPRLTHLRARASIAPWRDCETRRSATAWARPLSASLSAAWPARYRNRPSLNKQTTTTISNTKVYYAVCGTPTYVEQTRALAFSSS